MSRMSDVRILVVGLGSVGRRHLNNFLGLGVPVSACSSGKGALGHVDLPGDVVVHRDLAGALADRPTAVVVATPSALHLPVALAAARAGAHLLIEKPVADTLDGVDALRAEIERRRLIALLGFQFRFHPSLRQIRRWIVDGALGDIVSAQVHWGEYLPDMHPWEDYRTGYAARRDLGGGVLRTFCHPFDYLRWWFGDVSDVAATAGRVDPFGLDVETSVDVNLVFRRGAHAHVHLNFVQRPMEHTVRIVGTGGTATWSQADHTARRYDVQRGEWEVVAPPDGFERNTMFVAEAKHMLACLHGEDEPLCTFSDGVAALEVALRADALLPSAAHMGVA